MGDKTQVATVILAAQYDSMFWVVMGTTVGMLLANVPVALAGEWLLRKLPLDWVRRAACVLFVLFGVIELIRI